MIGFLSNFNNNIFCQKTLLSFNGNNNSIINSSDPVVYVVDDFEHKRVDIDGDGKGDMSHGDVVSLIIKSGIPSINLKSCKLKCEFKDNILNWNSQNLAENLERIIKYAKNGEKIDAINLSLGFHVPFDILSILMGKEINRVNVSEFRNEIINKLVMTQVNPDEMINSLNPHEILKNLDNNDTLKYFYPDYNNLLRGDKCRKYIELLKKFALALQKNKDIVRAIKDLNDNLHIPVYIGAGNYGEKWVNPLGLVEGENIIVVGATDSKGKKLKSSANNSTVSRYEQGVFDVSEIKDSNNKLMGYSITNPEIVEIPVEKVKDLPMISKFEKKNVNDFLASSDDQKLFEKIKTTNDLEGIEQSKLESMKGMLFYTYKGIPSYNYKEGEKVYTDFDHKAFFKIDNKGILTNKISPFNFIQGTSYSAPWALNLDIKKKCNIENQGKNIKFVA